MEIRMRNSTPCTPRFEFPATYSEILKPLNISALPVKLRELIANTPRVTEWVSLWETTSRAEKVSCWCQWTAEQTAAYDAEDYDTFSRLRGYTEVEIAQHRQFITMTHKLQEELGEDVMFDFSFTLWNAVATPASEKVEAEISRLSAEVGAS
jgi:hypothetical protein